MNISKLTEKYISERPSIKDCLKKKLINYSSLSRMIAKEHEIKNFDAILIACRRYFQKLKERQEMEKGVRDILRSSKVELRNKMIAVVIEKGVYHNSIIELEKEIMKKKETIDVIEGANAITLITSQDFLDTIKNLFGKQIIRVNKDLVEIIVRSPKEIENTPGVAAQLYSLFWERGINIAESMSCWTDTLFLIKEVDVPKMMEALRF